MKPIALAVVACLVTVGCSPNQADPSAEVDPPEVDGHGPAQVDPELTWATGLLAQSAQWEAVMPKPDPVDLRVYTLCRAPLPGELSGPHGYDNFGDFGPGPSQIPANQVVVSPLGRDWFYVESDNSKPVEITGPFAVGTVIIKEKYNDIDHALQRKHARAYGVMTKREKGYSPDHGDWEYGYIELNKEGEIHSATRGKLSSCIDCHANRSKTDYVFRSYPLSPKTR